MPGYPIRTPSDHSLVDNSPRTIVASHVLHRLLMPRHPPCALQHFNNTTQTLKPQNQTQQDARIHYATLNTPPHPNPPTTTTPTNGDALDSPGQEQPPKKTTHNGYLLRTQQHAELALHTTISAKNSGSCSTQPHPQQLQGMEITRRKPTTRCRGLPPPTGKAP